MLRLLKRKKLAIISDEEKEAKIEGLNKEIDGLFKYFKEISGKKTEMDLSECNSNLNGVIACLLEESGLPLTKLVEDIYLKVKERDGVSTTMALVKSSVLSVGQRSAYGVPNLDVDVLEDDTNSCLWCWEVMVLFRKEMIKEEKLPEDDDETSQRNLSILKQLTSQNIDSFEKGSHSNGEEIKHKTKKEVMDEIILKSKYFKAQKAKDKEENDQLMKKLNNDFTSLVQSQALAKALVSPRDLKQGRKGSKEGGEVAAKEIGKRKARGRDDIITIESLVKTTNPKKYCVRPNTGIIPPKSTCDIIVTMQAQKEAPADMQCKDKFLLQSVVTSSDGNNQEINPAMFNKESGHVVEEFKLRVVYVSLHQPHSSVQEGSEEGSSPRGSAFENGNMNGSEFSSVSFLKVQHLPSRSFPSFMYRWLTKLYDPSSSMR